MDGAHHNLVYRGKEKEHWITRQNHVGLYLVFAHQANPHLHSLNLLICKEDPNEDKRVDTGGQDLQNVK